MTSKKEFERKFETTILGAWVYTPISLQSQYWFRSSFKPFFLHNRLCVRNVICKHSETYLCLSGENYWDMVFSGFMCIKVLFMTNKAAWWRDERYFSCNLTCSYLGKLRQLIYCFRCIRTCLLICQKSPWKLPIKLMIHFYLLKIS